MDIKSKSNSRSRVIGFIISMLVISVVAVSVILTYQPILALSQRLAEKSREGGKVGMEEQNVNLKENFETLLERVNYVLYKDLLSEPDKQQLPSDIFLAEELRNLNPNEEGYSEKLLFKSVFNDVLQDWDANFYYDTIRTYPMLEYYIVDSRAGVEEKLTNSVSSIEHLLLIDEKSKQMKEQYPFYIIAEYDNDGSMRIMDYKGYDKAQIDTMIFRQQNRKILKEDMEENIYTKYIHQYYDQNKIISKEDIKEDIYDEYMEKYFDQIKSPSEVTIIYASQSENFFTTGGVATENQSFSLWDFSRGGFVYVVFFAAILVGLLALLLPLIKSIGIGEGISVKLPFELALAGVAFVFSIYDYLLAMAWETVTGFFITGQSIFSEKILHMLDYCFNFIVLVILGSILYVATLSIRRLFVIGIKRYIREQTITGRLYFAFKNTCSNIFLSLRTIDLTDKSNKVIIRILIVNFLILAILCSAWVIGIALLIPYSILLFIYIRKYIEDMKAKYSRLLVMASKMANGNLEVDFEEDLGIFEPLKNEITKVQYGFRKAVEEEMKSQRMKTELITNVSHDLKTPLTAIITYVNLLKEEKCTAEERKSYINTLDMKSQRLKLLIEDLFEVSKANSNNVILYLTEIDLVYLMKQVILENEDKLLRAGIELRLNLPENKVVLALDIDKTHRIFENLILNIAKYAMLGSRAYIEVISQKDKVIVVLKNTSATELNFNTAEITERFVRGDQSRNTEGSGLGLAIVKSFVELQNGSFEIFIDGDLFKAVITWRRS